MTAHQPVRTCIGCRRRAARNELLRVVAFDNDSPKTVIVDVRRRLAGRGAWLHPDRSCLAIAVKRKAFNRAFKSAVDVSEVQGYFNAEDAAGPSGGSMTTVQSESGSEMKMETR
ncbi:MAG TPA: YlxR family protein [Arthrobacter sp.]|nr:YlxR family protein [Arthrobacter sp.]